MLGGTGRSDGQGGSQASNASGVRGCHCGGGRVVPARPGALPGRGPALGRSARSMYGAFLPGLGGGRLQTWPCPRARQAQTRRAGGRTLSAGGRTGSYESATRRWHPWPGTGAGPGKRAGRGPGSDQPDRGRDPLGRRYCGRVRVRSFGTGPLRRPLYRGFRRDSTAHPGAVGARGGSRRRIQSLR